MISSTYLSRTVTTRLCFCMIDSSNLPKTLNAQLFWLSAENSGCVCFCMIRSAFFLSAENSNRLYFCVFSLLICQEHRAHFILHGYNRFWLFAKNKETEQNWVCLYSTHYLLLFFLSREHGCGFVLGSVLVVCRELWCAFVLASVLVVRREHWCVFVLGSVMVVCREYGHGLVLSSVVHVRTSGGFSRWD